METVVTEEIRERSCVGRRLVEGEEDVQLVADAIRNETVACSHARVGSELLHPHSFGPEHNKLDTSALSGTLPVSKLFKAQRQRIRHADPEVKEFLQRPYHSFNANRYLFSCADEPDGFAQNRASGWQYTLPQTNDLR